MTSFDSDQAVSSLKKQFYKSGIKMYRGRVLMLGSLLRFSLGVPTDYDIIIDYLYQGNK